MNEKGTNMPGETGSSADNVTDIQCSGIVTCVEFSPFQWSNSLIAFSSILHSVGTERGASSRITIGKLLSKDGNIESADGCFELLKEYHHNCSVTCLSWSPESVIAMLPYSIMLCAGGVDGNVTLITSDLQDCNEVMELGSHSKCVNSVAFDLDSGNTIASVGDDFKCILWSKEGAKVHEFPLKSAGVQVCFHKDDNTKLAIGEKSGVVSFYDVVSKTVFMSINCCQSLLKSFVWRSNDITTILALVGSNIVIFDTSSSSGPINKIPLGNSENTVSKSLALSSNGDLVAVSSGAGNHVKIMSRTRGDKVLLECDSSLGSGLSWHQILPLLAVGRNEKLRLINAAAY